MDADIFTGLFIVHSIESSQQLLVSHKSHFSNDGSNDLVNCCSLCRSNLEVIHLEANDHLFSLEITTIDAGSYLGTDKSKLSKCWVDLLLP